MLVASRKLIVQGTTASWIAELLANIKLDTETVSGFAFEIAGKGRDPAEVIEEWIAANSDRVDGWLGL